MRQNGFSLAELLLALLILGQIATFTIPKVLTAQQNAQREAVFKETYATLAELLYRGYQQGHIYESGGKLYAGWMLGQVNSLKMCDSSGTGQGCWNISDSFLTHSSCAAFRMHSGAVVASCAFDSNGNVSQHIAIDWNGETGPNLINEDQLEFLACADPGSCDFFGEITRPGTMAADPWSRNNDDSHVLYYALFQ